MIAVIRSGYLGSSLVFLHLSTLSPPKLLQTKKNIIGICVVTIKNTKYNPSISPALILPMIMGFSSSCTSRLAGIIAKIVVLTDLYCVNLVRSSIVSFGVIVLISSILMITFFASEDDK